MNKKKHFLVTTALETNLLENYEYILYLGDWCLPKGQDYSVAPYLWNTGDKINIAYSECDRIYRKTLTKLTPILNNLHNVDYEYKSYEIILGNWLKIYIHQLHDKYNSLKYAFENYNINDTFVLDAKNNYTPLEYIDYIEKIAADDIYLPVNISLVLV